jgi:hypothetical protein
LIIIEPYVDFFVKINYAGYPVDEAARDIFSEGLAIEIFKYILGIFLRIIPFGMLAAILFFLGMKIPKPLLIPVIIGGLVGIYSVWIPFVIDFYLPYYGPNPPTGAQAGMEFLILPFISIPFIIEGVLVGLLLSICVAMIINLISKPGQYYIRADKRKWYLLSTVFLICIFIFLLIPWNIKTVYTRRVKPEARSGNTSLERLTEIYQKADDTNNFQLLSLLARNPQSPESMLTDLYEIGKDSKMILTNEIIFQLVINPNTPEEIYYKIYEHCLPHVEKEPICIKIPIISFFSLFFSPYWNYSDIMKQFASSQRTPGTMLGKMVGVPDEDIRRIIARNERTPLVTLEILSNDKDPSVRRNLCYNNSITKEILFKLQKDPSPQVKSAAEYKLKKLDFIDK